MTEPIAVGALPRRTAHALDLMAFSLADVRDGLGPYLSVYLLLTHHWDQASIGFVMAVGGIAGVVAQTPVGALVDKTTAKRALASLSNFAAGGIVVGAGYGVAFMSLGAIAAIGFVLYLIAMPETAGGSASGPRIFASKYRRHMQRGTVARGQLVEDGDGHV